MPRKKKPSLLNIFVRIIALSFWELLVALIPAAIAILQFFGGTVEILEQVPSWVWVVLAIFGFVVVMIIGVQRYKKELENESKKTSSKKAKTSIKSNQQRGGITGEVKARDIYQGGIHFYGDKPNNDEEKGFQSDNRPILYSYAPEIRSGQLPGVLTDTGMQYRPHIVIANFYNKPAKITEDCVAKKVHADVEYYDTDMNPVFEIRGQWHIEGEWEYPSRDHYARRIQRDLQSLHGFSEIDFRPDGEPQTLYLAIRHFGERETFIVSQESYQYQYLKHPLYRLQEKKCYIYVTLRPENSEGIERWFVLLNDEYLKITEIEKPQILLYPLSRENGKYVSLRVINNNQDEPVLCKAIMTKMEWFEQDPKNIDGGKWVPINTDENGPLSWHHGGTDNEGYKKVHINPEFINIAKIPEDMNHLIRGNFIFTFLVEKPYKIGRYRIWVDVISKTGDRFKKETWIGCIDMVDPMHRDELTIMECEDVEEWKEE